jgi:anthranilate synthase
MTIYKDDNTMVKLDYSEIFMLEHVKTTAGIFVEYQQQNIPYANAIEPLLERLNSQRGALFASSYEVPGRYTCWDIGFYNPPLVLTCTSHHIEIRALNARGEFILHFITSTMDDVAEFKIEQKLPDVCTFKITAVQGEFSEEERSQQPSVFSLLRHLLSIFKSEDEAYLGLYGALGYDLIFHFEDIPEYRERDSEQRTMVLYLPDEIFVVNHQREEAFVRRYDFQFQGESTHGLPRTGEHCPYQPSEQPAQDCDHQPGEYAKLVDLAKERFACGDLFEVVPSQTFFLPCFDNPSQVFMRMRTKNPSPYGFLINLGQEEYLVGASPEMYVRVNGKRVETCPISGTIQRGKNAIEDAQNIQTLLESEKECSELTMCTDVDRNDKSRICEPGSVQVIGRRQIEMYSRVIHTVDHVEGILRDGYDAVDAFLTHMWVVTVTGAPKLWAMKFIEQHEKTSRKWYGGAVGWFNFNGNLNTGLVLRTMRLKKGIAEIRAGATLLFDSNPEAEEQETRLKASAFLDILKKSEHKNFTSEAKNQDGRGKKVLLIDHQDSFVHTLANYVRQTGAEVITVRSDLALSYLERDSYDLVLLSPGPGRPDDFKLARAIEKILSKSLPLFGVCLGLQGIVEYFGGTLDVLKYPMHGKASTIHVLSAKGLFAEFEPSFTAGRYHSLYARKESLPKVLEVTAESEDGVIMAVSHRELPIHAVQFHPETILSLPNKAGLRIINNLMRLV